MGKQKFGVEVIVSGESSLEQMTNELKSYLKKQNEGIQLTDFEIHFVEKEPVILE